MEDMSLESRLSMSLDALRRAIEALGAQTPTVRVQDYASSQCFKAITWIREVMTALELRRALLDISSAGGVTSRD